MHYYTIDFYCYPYNYFTVLALQVVFHCFVDSIYHHREQKGRWFFLFRLDTIFVQFNPLHIFNALIFILHHSHSLFCQLNQPLLWKVREDKLFVLTENIFLQFNSIHIFNAFTFILQDTLTLFSYYFPYYSSSQFWIHKIHIESKVRDRQQKPVLAFFITLWRISCALVIH